MVSDRGELVDPARLVFVDVNTAVRLWTPTARALVEHTATSEELTTSAEHPEMVVPSDEKATVPAGLAPLEPVTVAINPRLSLTPDGLAPELRVVLDDAGFTVKLTAPDELLAKLLVGLLV